MKPEEPLEWNWHIEFLCGVAQGEVTRIGARLPKLHDIIVNLSPRYLKSEIWSIAWAPWAWINYPYLKFIGSSHSADLSTEHCVMSRRIIESEWYQRRWGHKFRVATDQNVKTHYENNKRGKRMAASVTGGISGKGADIIVADDILDVKDAYSIKKRKTSNEHYRNGLWTRLNNKKVGVRVIVMQRLSEQDIVGVEMKDRPDNYLKICIPAEIVERRATPDGPLISDVSPPELREFYRDGSFFPARFDTVAKADAKKMGTLNYGAQYLQAPTPVAGNIFGRDWWRYWDVNGLDGHAKLPERFDFKIQSWDLSFDGGPDASYTVGQVWGAVGARFYLLYQFREQIGFTEQIEAIKKVTQMYPDAFRKLIEKKANGAAAIDFLCNTIAGMEAIEPNGDKVVRGMAVSPVVESGNVYLPNPSRFPWVLEYVERHASFPDVDFDDEIDATSQALVQLNDSSVANMESFVQM